MDKQDFIAQCEPQRPLCRDALDTPPPRIHTNRLPTVTVSIPLEYHVPYSHSTTPDDCDSNKSADAGNYDAEGHVATQAFKDFWPGTLPTRPERIHGEPRSRCAAADGYISISIALIVVHGRPDSAFRQAFFVQFVAVSVVDCLRNDLRKSGNKERALKKKRMDTHLRVLEEDLSCMHQLRNENALPYFLSTICV